MIEIPPHYPAHQLHHFPLGFDFALMELSPERLLPAVFGTFQCKSLIKEENQHIFLLQ